jgi:hypothetical protein
MNRRDLRSVIRVAAGVGLAGSISCSRPPEYPIPPPTLQGNSSSLKATIVVPTLDTPIPARKNVVWCATFQLAWEKMRDDVSKQSIAVESAVDVAKRLNSVKGTENDLPANSYTAMAGLLQDNIISRIQSEMASRFPLAPKPTFEVKDGDVGAVAYAYLTAGAKFTIPYFDDPEPLVFKDSAGVTSNVSCFGIRKKDASQYRELRSQVAVLYSDAHLGLANGAEAQYGVDLCRSTSDVQVIAAVVARRDSLSEMVGALDKKVAEYIAEIKQAPGLSANDTLYVPTLNWRLVHRFKELEGKIVTNGPLAGLPIAQAEQMIDFRLDRSGVMLESESKLAMASIPARYAFDRPFLIILRRRGASRPFFVMWVDNAELLKKAP